MTDLCSFKKSDLDILKLRKNGLLISPKKSRFSNIKGVDPKTLTVNIFPSLLYRCPRSLDPFHTVCYYIKWVKTYSTT